jgi:hypothetical protein
MARTSRSFSVPVTKNPTVNSGLIAESTERMERLTMRLARIVTRAAALVTIPPMLVAVTV